jgi:MFS transporter, DHA1 family, multidrug resistance protein
MGPVLCCHALMTPNFNAIAMQPMAAVAGTASALIGALQVAGGALIATGLSATFDGTVLPLSVGFLGSALAATVLVLWAEGGRLFEPLVPQVPPDPTPLTT